MENEKFPAELKYNEEHTWLKLDNGKARVGITYYAQEQLKDIVFIELPEVGTKVVYMQPFGVVESAKATNDLFSPASGVVVETNDFLKNEPGIINQDPYGKGWMIVIELSNPAEIDQLINAESYKIMVKG